MSEKIQVARTSAIAGGTLALLKLAIGFLTGSLALISEGFHSSLDFLVTLITWISVKTADVPADAHHHYGHGKLENLSAFGEAILLAMTGVWITWESISNLIHHAPRRVDNNWWLAIAVVSLSILVDLSRSRALFRAARKFKSQALEADAIHFGTELLSSLVVLVVLVLVKIDPTRYSWADSAGAIAVAAVMIFTAVRLGRRAADVLIDRAPEGLDSRIQEIIRSVPGVRDVARIRARQSGENTFVDATILVDPALDLAAGHLISDTVELRVTESFSKLDILVHVEPAPPAENHAEAIHQLAIAMKLSAHAIRIREIAGRLYLNFHVEFPPQTTLAEAHQLVTELETRIHRHIPTIAEIDTHLEPMNSE
jgi:cation diffusion facilitator family transporter